MLTAMRTFTWPRRAAASLIVVVGPTLVCGCGGGSAAPTTVSPSSAATPTSSPATTAEPANAAQATTTPGTAVPTTAVPTTAEPTTTVPSTTTSPGRTGVFVTAPGGSPVTGSGTLLTYSVAVEESLGLNPEEVAEVVDRTLADPRSWTADGSTAFQRVESGSRVQIIVASPATVDSRCLPLNTAGTLSCRSGNSVNINADRWLGATSDWSLDLDAYRSYVVNHEVGHVLGHGHEQCGGPGTLAPVMMQQTKGLEGCAGNPWPFP